MFFAFRIFEATEDVSLTRLKELNVHLRVTRAKKLRRYPLRLVVDPLGTISTELDQNVLLHRLALAGYVRLRQDGLNLMLPNEPLFEFIVRRRSIHDVLRELDPVGVLILEPRRNLLYDAIAILIFFKLENFSLNGSINVRRLMHLGWQHELVEVLQTVIASLGRLLGRRRLLVALPHALLLALLAFLLELRLVEHADARLARDPGARPLHGLLELFAHLKRTLVVGDSIHLRAARHHVRLRVHRRTEVGAGEVGLQLLLLLFLLVLIRLLTLRLD